MQDGFTQRKTEVSRQRIDALIERRSSPVYDANQKVEPNVTAGPNSALECGWEDARMKIPIA